MSNLFRVKNGLSLSPVDLATLTNPQAGDLACDINDSNKIKRYDANASAWTEVGSGGGVGGTDIFFVQDFESASLASFTQTGLTLSQTDPLHGRISALLTHQAGVSPTNDQKFKQIIPVDRKFRGETMTLRLNAKSNASAGNVTINIYDETNAANLVASEQLQLSNDVSGAISRVGFTIPETCASISYTITALPEAGSPVTRIDDIIAELAVTSLLETSVEVPVVTAWQGYTPTFQGFGTPTNIEFEWRQVGENVEIRGKFTSGTPTAVEARVGLPGGLTSAGTSLIPSLQVAGFLAYGNAGAFKHDVLVEPSVTYVTFGVQDATRAGLTKGTGSSVTGNGITLSFFASVPCAGLSATTTKTIPLTQSGLVQKVDSTLKVNTPVRGTTSTGVYNFTNTQTSIGSDVLFQQSTTLGSTFTIQETGIYALSFSVVSNLSNSTSAAAAISRNQTSAGTTAAENLNAAELLASSRDTDITSGAAKFASTSWTGILNEGDIIRFHGNPADVAVASSSTATISRQGSLKQIAVSSDQKLTIPTSELRMEGASARGTSPSNAIVKFDSVAKLRGDAFTVNNDPVLGTSITMKKAGKLDVSANIRQSSAATYFSISKNQANLTAVATVASEVLAFANPDAGTSYESMSWSGFVSVGDIIRVSAGANPTSDSSQSLNLSFQEQDISVSVSNTLPQFSESDSSVRVSGWAGVGSTGTKIGRYSGVLSNIGTAIEYVPSSINGDSFVVKESGIYNINSFFDAGSTAGSGWIVGLSVDSPNLAANIYDIPVANQLSEQLISSNGELASASWQGYLTAGQIVRAQFGNTLPASIDRASFTISKVGKPNVTGVDVTPFVNVQQQDVEAISANTSTAASTFGSTNTGVPVLNIEKNTNKGILVIDSSATLGTSFRALKKCQVNISGSAQFTNLGAFYLSVNSTVLTSGSLTGEVSRVQNYIASSGAILGISASVELQPGDVLRFQRDSSVSNVRGVSLTATAASDSIITPNESFSTDTAQLTWAPLSSYTLSTLQNAPVGTYITFTYAANTNTRTQTTTRPTQTDADMNTNGILLYTRAYNAASTAAQPAAFAIQIGKGLKGKSLDLYKSAGKVTAGNLDYVVASSTNQGGLYYRDYNESTGILIIDAGVCALPTNTVNTFSFSDVSSQTSGYLVINASKNSSLTGMNIERVSARAINSAGTSIANTGETAFVFDSTKSFDTHGALNTSTGVFTAPESGYYSYSAAILANSLAYTVANAVIIRAYKNSSNNVSQFYWSAQTTSAVPANVQGSDVVFLAKGDTLEFRLATSRAGGAVTLNTASVFNFVSIAKVNIGGRN